MTRFNKTYCSPSQLVQVLKARGLEISDEDRAERYLNNIGYYRLSAYTYSFLKEPKTDHRFKDNISFDRVLRLYRFDKKLRMLLFNEIEKIEIVFRQTVANVTAQMSGNIFWMTDVSSYSNSSKAAKSITLITNEYNKSREDFIEHFKRTYTNPFPPGWITVEILPLGNMTWLYSNLADQRIRKAIAKILHLQAPVLDSWMTIITLTRNSCCHHARMWNKINPIIPNDMKNNFKNKLTGILNLFPEIDLRAMGFNANWEQLPPPPLEIKQVCDKWLVAKRF
ncbi:MAG: Abi family protein [Paludibacteraceae bacterium]|nr:Abi family protein [Paludibacteraceae bacterium]